VTGQIEELRKPRPVPAVVGRTDELSRITDFVAGPGTGTRVLVLDGAPGVGKTTLWEAGVTLAR
jgi:ATP-dependent Clp protease ATP-binding subunit ClpA